MLTYRTVLAQFVSHLNLWSERTRSDTYMSRSDTEVITSETAQEIMRCESTRNFLTKEKYFKALTNWIPLKNTFKSWQTVALYGDLLVCSGRSFQGHSNVKCRSFSFSTIFPVPYGVRVDINFHGMDINDLFEHLNLHFANVVKMVRGRDTGVGLLIHMPQGINAEKAKEFLKPAFGNTYKSSIFTVEFDYIKEQPLHMYTGNRKSAL